MSKLPEDLHRWKRKILVGVQSRQCLCGLVFFDLLVDFFAMCPNVGPSIGEIRSF
jgi:hypothetical protein